MEIGNLKIILILKLINWLKNSFVGPDGKASSRKLTAFAFSLTTFILIYADLFFDLTVDPILIIGSLSMTAISLGLMTAQNIVDIFKRNSYENYTDCNRSNNNTPTE